LHICGTYAFEITKLNVFLMFTFYPLFQLSQTTTSSNLCNLPLEFASSLVSPAYLGPNTNYLLVHTNTNTQLFQNETNFETNCYLLKYLRVWSAVWVKTNGRVRANILLKTERFVSLAVNLGHLHIGHVFHPLQTCSFLYTL